MSTSKETARDVLSGISILEEPRHEEVKTVLGSEVAHKATPGAVDSNIQTPGFLRRWLILTPRNLLINWRRMLFIKLMLLLLLKILFLK